jgi:tetratricopeptide (TPR) repeat protein
MDVGLDFPASKPSLVPVVKRSIIMKKPHFCALLALALTTFTPLLAQEAPAEDSPAWLNKFLNLAPTDQKKFEGHFMEAARLFGQKRIFETLNEITEAEKIYKEYPSTLNLKGACYVEFRDFKIARENFVAALALSPKSADIIFNIAEVDFVTENWVSCEKNLNEALLLTNEKKIQMTRLIEFKLLLAKIKLNKTEEVEALSKKYGFDDDSPFHYYAEAAMAYEREDREKAEEWLGICRRVFLKAELLARWQDTLIAYGHIPSVYGGDLEDPSALTPPTP